MRVTYSTCPERLSSGEQTVTNLKQHIEDDAHGGQRPAHRQGQHRPRPPLPDEHAPLLSPQPMSERGRQGRGRGGATRHVGDHVDARAVLAARGWACLGEGLPSGGEELHQGGVDEQAGGLVGSCLQKETLLTLLMVCLSVGCLTSKQHSTQSTTHLTHHPPHSPPNPSH